VPDSVFFGMGNSRPILTGTNNRDFVSSYRTSLQNEGISFDESARAQNRKNKKKNCLMWIVPVRFRQQLIIHGIRWPELLMVVPIQI